MTDPRLTLMEAIARQKIVTASYNGNAMRLAPHMMFERHGDLFISALNLDKNWISLDVMRLGQFKLDGLSNVALTDDGFEPLESFEAEAPRPEDTLVLAA